MFDKETLAKIYCLNPQELPIGSVAYFVNQSDVNKWNVGYGLVEAHYTHNIVLTMLDANKTARTVEGIPFSDFTMTEWRKLPKGWSYDTDLVGDSLQWSNYQELNTKYQAIDYTNPSSILQAYKDGVLIEVEKNDYGYIDAEIDRKNGYRLVKKYPMWQEDKAWNKSFYYWEIYKDYASVQAVIDEQRADLKRLSEMTDEEYSIYMFTNTIDNSIYDDSYKQRCKDFLMKQDKISDIVVRASCRGIEWRYEKNKRWNTIST